MADLDIVIPVYNEGAGILPVLDSLRCVQTSMRVFICYDHDDDSTLKALQENPAAGIPVNLLKNSGRGAHDAVVTGFGAATAPAVIVFPGDDVHNAAILDRMYAKFLQGCEIVAASRLMPGGRMEGCPLLKAVLLRSAAFTLHRLAKVPSHDATNGFRLFSRRTLEQIEIESSRGFTYSLELLVKAHRLGWKVGEVPAQWHERTQGRSRFRVLRWLPAYLRWYCYAFATTYLRRPANSVRLRRAAPLASNL